MKLKFFRCETFNDTIRGGEGVCVIYSFVKLEEKQFQIMLMSLLVEQILPRHPHNPADKR